MSAIYKDGQGPLLTQSFDFALAIISYTEMLQELRKYEMAKQLFKSGTSIHAQIREAQHPESNKDFIHKLKMGMKEASETEGWLLLCVHAPSYPDARHLLERLLPLQKMLSKAIHTAKESD